VDTRDYFDRLPRTEVLEDLSNQISVAVVVVTVQKVQIVEQF
jgi:hypothetical protein